MNVEKYCAFFNAVYDWLEIIGIYYRYVLCVAVTLQICKFDQRRAISVGAEPSQTGTGTEKMRKCKDEVLVLLCLSLGLTRQAATQIPIQLADTVTPEETSLH